MFKFLDTKNPSRKGFTTSNSFRAVGRVVWNVVTFRWSVRIKINKGRTFPRDVGNTLWYNVSWNL